LKINWMYDIIDLRIGNLRLSFFRYIFTDFVNSSISLITSVVPKLFFKCLSTSALLAQKSLFNS